VTQKRNLMDIIFVETVLIKFSQINRIFVRLFLQSFIKHGIFVSSLTIANDKSYGFH